MSNIITNGCFEAWDDANTPTGWTPVITAGAGETSSIHAGAGNDPIEDILKQYTNRYEQGDFHVGLHPSSKGVDIAVDELGTDVHMHQHLTLVPATEYHLTGWYRMGYDLNELLEEEQVLGGHAPQIKLIEDGNGHSLLVAGTWQADGNGVIALPTPKAEWQRLSIRFTTPATHTAYTLEFDSNNMHGTEYVAAAEGPPIVVQVVGYEHLYLDNFHIEEVVE
jgi:hypothetical protein